jgi:type II secretory pathway pseudopilin PulG/predicted transcriptional regulator YdeE
MNLRDIKKFYLINKMKKNKINRILKKESGFTLIEVVIAFLIIAIITVVLVRGTIVSVDVIQADKAKTLSLAVANEKLELLKNMEYDDVELVEEGSSGYDDWLGDHPELEEDGYDIDYAITWVDGEENSYKQVELTIFKEPMNIPVTLITQIYYLEGQEGSGEVEHPAPVNLSIEYDTGSGSGREIKLVWEAPDTEKEIDKYNVYMEGALEGDSLTELYVCYPGDDDNHSFYVTAVYTDEIESDPSNTVSTEIEVEHPAPVNLSIEYDTGSGSGREIRLVWEAPDTEMEIDKYNVYMDGALEGDSLTELYVCYPGDDDNHSFYVTAVYTDEIESDPSNTVSTEIEVGHPPPQNLRITGYSGGGNNRRVNLAWDAPDTQLSIVEYVVYRNGSEVGRTADISFSNKIGRNNYTFFITAIYEDETESGPSNEVTTAS